MKAKLDEVGGRVLLGDNTGGGAVILVCIRLERVAVWTSTGLPTNSNSAASQEIPRNYRNRRFISAFTSIILTHSNLVHASSSKFLKINFNIILSSTPRSPKCTSSLGSPPPPPKPCTHLSSLIRAIRPAHPIVLDLITRVIFGEEYRAQSSPLCSLLHSLVTSSLTFHHVCT